MISCRLRQRVILMALLTVVMSFAFSSQMRAHGAEAARRPNLLIFMTDNQYYEHLGCYGDPVVKTPHIDKLAETGVRFTHAFCNSPSCTPARSAYLTGQDIWRLEEGANLWSALPGKFPVYTDLLAEAGYFVGYEGKGWGPGDKTLLRDSDPGGALFKSFDGFVDAKADEKPWSYWVNIKEPHRPYTQKDAGAALGMNRGDIKTPPYLPDSAEVRGDIADYLLEIQLADQKVGEILQRLDALGERDNTVIVFCSDNGWQMPRGLANLYDFGTRVPLVISWPGRFSEGRVADDLVYLNDLAPTFLDLAGVHIPKEMTARSLRPVLMSDRSKNAAPFRDAVVLARERHAYSRQDGMGYPGRAIRTRDYLYIRNYEADRWPAGDPPLFGDIDSCRLTYYSPTKEYMMVHKDDPSVRPLYALGFGKRPAEELYDLKRDPYQMKNVAGDKAYEAKRVELAGRLQAYLVRTGDPRALGLTSKIIWDTQDYQRPEVRVARPGERAIEKFGLKEVYDYRPRE